jgi:cephalosporin hydroxylase
MPPRHLPVTTALALCLCAGLSGCQERTLAPAEVTEQFSTLWYNRPDTWQTMHWLGIRTLQNPMDVWIIQEILHELEPDFMIECGSANGGSAALWATILDNINPDAKVISIDIEDKMQAARELPIVKRRVEFIIGSSTSPDVVEQVRKQVAGKKVVVLLDSDHRKAHVLEELKQYAPLVGVGGYIIVQDTNINGHPVLPGFGPGPWEAVEEFLQGDTAFEVDRQRERFLFTFSPNGYLKRVR